jgi:hypothetical protein
MRNRTALTILFALSLACCPRPGYCWDGVGHMLIAQIAYDRLTPAARAVVEQLSKALNNDPLTGQLDGADLPVDPINIATWPDEIKSLGAETHQYSAWHYIDLDSLPPVNFDSGADGLPAMPIANQETIADVKSYTDDRSDVYEQILQQSSILANRSNSIADRARALAFVEHFVGDIHQPLHAVGRQLGGNRYPIDLTTPDRHFLNLHSFWDTAYEYRVVGGVVIVDPLYAGGSEAGPDSGWVKAWADSIVTKYLTRDRVILSQTDPAAWAVESNELATTFAFPEDGGSSLSTEYIQKAGDIARERIALAGVRLANRLNYLLTVK